MSEVPQTFSDFLSPTSSDEGPVRTTNIERQRYKRKGGAEKKLKRQQRRARRRR